MITTTVMPKATVSELLLYLAEQERFASVSGRMGSGVTVEEVRAVLRELARELAREAAEEAGVDREELARGSLLTPRVKEILSCLSDHEERRLFSAFGLVDADMRKAEGS